MYICKKEIFTLLWEVYYVFIKNIINQFMTVENYPDMIRIFSNFLF